MANTIWAGKKNVDTFIYELFLLIELMAMRSGCIYAGGMGRVCGQREISLIGNKIRFL